MENKKSPMLGLRTTIYMVEELEKARDWYSRAFQTSPYWDTPYYVGFNIGGYELGLHPKDEGMGKDTSNVLTYWGVEDIEQVYRLLIDAGATEHEAPNNVGGDIVVASVRDPWGNIIGIIYNPDFKLQA